MVAEILGVAAVVENLMKGFVEWVRSLRGKRERVEEEDEMVEEEGMVVERENAFGDERSLEMVKDAAVAAAIA